MDFFSSSYFRINKNLHSITGVWPYQKPTQKIILRSLVILLNVTVALPEILHLIYVRNNWILLVDCLPIFLSHIIHMVKYASYLAYNDQMKVLLDKIKEDWQKITKKEEVEILRHYTTTARTVSRIFFYTYYTCAVVYMCSPTLPRVLDYYFPLNETRPYIYVFDFEYIVDPKEYFIPIWIHQCTITLVIEASIVATDTTYGTYTHHGCALFAILRYQLENLTFAEKSKFRLAADEKEDIQVLKECVKRHKEAINFCDLIEFAHVKSLFVIMFISVLSLTMTGLQTVSHINQPLEAPRFAAFCIGHFWHVFFYCWNSQNINDHSSAIYEAAYNTKWYTNSIQCRKIIVFMTHRASKPCIQTAGKILPLTIETFTVIAKTSFSYFTVLSNFQ